MSTIIETNGQQAQHRDFAKIVRASDGRQVLFYVEDEGGDYKFHQIVEMDICMADMAIGFADVDEEIQEAKAYALLECADTEMAEKLIETIKKMLDC